MADESDELPENQQTTEEVIQTVGTDPLFVEVQALHQDVIACRDVLTILAAIVLAYTASKIILGWFHGR